MAAKDDGGPDLKQEFIERDLTDWRKLRARGDERGLTRAEWQVYRTVDDRLMVLRQQGRVTDAMLERRAKGDGR